MSLKNIVRVFVNSFSLLFNGRVPLKPNPYMSANICKFNLKRPPLELLANHLGKYCKTPTSIAAVCTFKTKH